MSGGLDNTSLQTDDNPPLSQRVLNSYVKKPPTC